MKTLIIHYYQRVKKYFRTAIYKDYLAKNRKLAWALAGLAAIVALWLLWGGIQALFGLNAPKYRTAPVEEGAMVSAIRASGSLNPVKSVTVGTGVSGMIKELLVDFNDPVKEGQLIARIDPRDYQARYDQAEANYLLARKNHQLNLALAEKGFISKQALIQTEMAMKAAQGALNSAKKSLDDTYIRSPVDGVVVKRSVEVGQTVAASLASPEIFIIAQNLADMQVETSIDESDVGKIKEGQEASFTVDAFPGQVFNGKVLQIRKAPVNIQNVVTYTVLISANNPDLKLLPGMTANARILVDERDKALKISNAALRFRLPNAEAIIAAENKASAKSQGKPEGDKADSRSSRGTRPLAGGSNIRRVWVLERVGLKQEPVRKVFRAGITDGDYTEVLPLKDGEPPSLKPGDQVIVGIEGQAGTKPASNAPRMF